MGDKGHAEAYHDEPAEGEEVGEPRKDGTAPTDELEVLNEKKDQPPAQHKPRRGTSPYCLTHTRCVNKCYRLLSDYFLLAELLRTHGFNATVKTEAQQRHIWLFIGLTGE